MSTANDNTAKWAVRKFGGAGLPVGFEYLSMNPNIPAGSLPLLGGVYSRTVYKDLWAWVQTQAGYLLEESEWQAKASTNEGNVPYYSSGDGSTTFRVPSLKCWIKGANGIEEVGSYLEAGLPNITGEADVDSAGDNATCVRNQSGAFKNRAHTTIYTTAHSTVKELDFGITFDASRCSSIYGNSDTVQPKSIVGMWLVKAYGTVSNVGSTDVADIAVGLTEAETRIGQLENHGAGATVVESYRNGTEWYRVWSDGWLEQGGSVSHPNDYLNTHSFLRPYSSNQYTLIGVKATDGSWTSSDVDLYMPFSSRTTTSFGTYTNNDTIISWYACGQGA